MGVEVVSPEVTCVGCGRGDVRFTMAGVDEGGRRIWFCESCAKQMVCGVNIDDDVIDIGNVSDLPSE